jgi:hypothetical protein
MLVGVLAHTAVICIRDLVWPSVSSSTHARIYSLLSLLTQVRLILPGELAKHAVSEGTKAVTKFTSA